MVMRLTNCKSIIVKKYFYNHPKKNLEKERNKIIRIFLLEADLTMYHKCS